MKDTPDGSSSSSSSDQAARPGVLVDGSTAPVRGALAESAMLDVELAPSPDPNGFAAVASATSDPLLGSWSDEHENVLSTLVANNTFAVPWPTLRQILKLKIERNIESFLALPSHAPEAVAASRATAAATAAATSGASGSEGASSSMTQQTDGEATTAEREPTFNASSSGGTSNTGPSSGATVASARDPTTTMVDGGEASAAAPGTGSKEAAAAADVDDDDATAEARVNPGWLIGGRTLPSSITRAEADVLERRIRGLLDAFENNPPFTVQRLAELVVAPQASHGSLGKHLRAILRVLDVHSEWTPPSSASAPFSVGGPSATAADAIGERGSGAWSVGTPLFSPIPFLARDELENASAAAADADHRMDDGESVGSGGGSASDSAASTPMSPMSLGSPLPIRSSSSPPSASTLLPSTSSLMAVEPPPLPTSSSPADGGPLLSPSRQTTDTIAHGDGPTPSTLSSDELIVDELDGGLALLPSTSTAAPLGAGESSSSDGSGLALGPQAHEGEGANQHAHLLAASPRAFTTTTTTTGATSSGGDGTPSTPPPTATTRVRPRESEDAEMAGPEEEVEGAERFVRSKSPTPDVGRVQRTPGAPVPAGTQSPPPTTTAPTR